MISSDSTVYESARSASTLTLGPIPGSRKIHVSGSRPDLRVPMRAIAQSDTREAEGSRPNPEIPVYDTSGPYTDPMVKIDLRTGLGDVRSTWIEERNDTEVLQDSHSEFTNARLSDPKLASLRFNLTRKPRRAKAG